MHTKLKIVFLIFVGTFLFTLLDGCKKKIELIQACDRVSCVNGSCVDGRCKCDTGYTGELCEAETVAKYIGNFSGTEPCSVTGSGMYYVAVTKNDTDMFKVNFRNLWDENDVTYGNLGQDGNIYIPYQPITDRGRWIEGKAMIINSKLRISYSITGGSFTNAPDNCIWQQQ